MKSGCSDLNFYHFERHYFGIAQYRDGDRPCNLMLNVTASSTVADLGCRSTFMSCPLRSEIVALGSLEHCYDLLAVPILILI